VTLKLGDIEQVFDLLELIGDKNFLKLDKETSTKE